MLDPSLDELTLKRARACPVDWRNAWAGLDESRVLRAWPRPAAEALGAAALAEETLLGTNSILEPMRAQPSHRAEMISEVLAGEELRGLVHRDRWWLVATPDNYVGWVHEWVLQAGTPAPAPSFLYGRPTGTLWISDHQAGAPLWFGMGLTEVEGPLSQRGDQHLLRAPTGEEGWVSIAELRPPGPLGELRDVLNLLRGLAGVPYRWGGRSPLGFDCSGLVQFTCRLAGVELPRDAAQQSGCGEELGRDQGAWTAGDLIFFGDPADHVAFYDGRGGILHCQGRVRRDKLEGHDLQARISGVRRWWPREDGGD